MSFSITLDRNADIHIEGRVRINVDPPPDPQACVLVKLTARLDRFITSHTGATRIMYTLPADKQVLLQVEYVDKNDNPASVDGAVEWSSSDEEIAKVNPFTVAPHAGAAPSNVPLNGVVMLVPGTKLGTCQITVKADADLGEGVRELVTLLDVNVVGGEAVKGTITPAGEQVAVP